MSIIPGRSDNFQATSVCIAVGRIIYVPSSLPRKHSPSTPHSSPFISRSIRIRISNLSSTCQVAVEKFPDRYLIVLITPLLIIGIKARPLPLPLPFPGPIWTSQVCCRPFPNRSSHYNNHSNHKLNLSLRPSHLSL
jgi:hypothetical protein